MQALAVLQRDAGPAYERVVGHDAEPRGQEVDLRFRLRPAILDEDLDPADSAICNREFPAQQAEERRRAADIVGLDAHGGVIDYNPIEGQRPCDYATGAAHFDASGRHALQLRQRELETLLRVEQALRQ